MAFRSTETENYLFITIDQISITWFYKIFSNMQVYAASYILVISLRTSRDELLFHLYSVIGHG